MLFENLLAMIKKNVLMLLAIPFWLVKGKAYLKSRVFEYGDTKAEDLPYNNDVIAYLEKLKVDGYSTYLVTASLQSTADDIGQHLDIFDGCYGTKENINLKSKNKKAFLNDKFGKGNYIYIGDSNADLKVWEDSKGAVVVGRNKAFSDKVSKLTAVHDRIPNRNKSYLKTLVKQIRVYQWVKNILMFLPIMTAHIQLASDYIQAFWAFIAFSLVASSVYVTNDLLDLTSDRHHPRKRKRPLASGDMPLLHGLFYAPFLFLLGYIIAFFIVGRGEFILVLTVYYTITTAYSFLLKRIAIMDIIVLAILYTIRIIAGSAATGVSTSEWLLAFTMFIFISLAVVKRYTELIVMKKDKKTKIMGRGYQTEDAALLLGIGPASGYLAVLVFTLYVNSPKVATLYSEPILLWAIAPFMLFWVTRMWLLAHRGEMTDDPIVFTVKDKYSYIIGFFVLSIALTAKLI
jgi:4-hydroxybenzoate polyprenyltransferase